MIKELVVGILSEYRNKPLTLKRIKEIGEKIVTATTMLRDVPVDNNKVGAEVVQSEHGQKAIVAIPEEKNKVNRTSPVIIAFPDGDEVTPYKIG